MGLREKFGRVLLALVLACGLFPGVALAEPAASQEAACDVQTAATLSEESYVAGEILVVCEEGVFADVLGAGTVSTLSVEFAAPTEDALIQDVQVVAELPDTQQEVVKVEVAEDQMEEALDALDDMPGVAYAQRNFVYELVDGYDALAVDDALEQAEGQMVEANAASAEAAISAVAGTSAAATDDPALSEQYYLGSWEDTFGASVEDAWDLVTSDHSVTIAVLDTGVLSTHEDLAANLDTAHMKDIVNTGKATGSISDSMGHGTHVAGIACAVANNGVGIAGTSCNANLLPLQVFYRQGSSYKTSSEYLLKAYEYLDGLVEDGDLTDLHVINLSVGGYGTLDEQDYALEDAIEEMRNNHDVLTVCAGGNGDGKTAYTKFCMPSDFDACLSVTSLNARGSEASYSDYNEYKDISAPGENIYSTLYSGTSAYGTMNGTSMSSPLVAGIAALLWAEYPDLTVDQAVEALETTANPLAEGEYNRGSASGSAGCVDAAAAVQYVIDYFEGSQKRFDDVDYSPSNWQVEGINYVSQTGLMTGYSGEKAGLFGPNDNVTRGQVATILFRASGDVDSSASADHAASIYSDVDADSYYARAIDWCYKKGIATGYSGDQAGSFGPDDYVTREQLAKMLTLYARYQGQDVDNPSYQALNKLKEVDRASSWAVPFLAWCTDEGVINGFEIDGSRYLHPQANATRAQMAKMVMVLVRDVLGEGTP